jgi:uncharacterized protein
VTPWELAAGGAAGFVAGAVNALAGGGTLVSFPVLIAIGLPPVAANVTNTVALSPGYLGGVLSQRTEAAAQRHRIRQLAVVAAVGGLAGSILLVLTSDDAFRNLIPALILFATLLLAAQERLRTRLLRNHPSADPDGGAGSAPPHDPPWLAVPVFLVSIYGGYFGAGLGIMLLAVLGIVLPDPLPRLNALKQVLAFVINVTAAIFFLTSGKVYWGIALVMAITSLAGGAAGGRVAGSVKPEVLRAIVVVIGLTVSVVYAVRYWF